MPFVDRTEAGRQLAERLRWLSGQDAVVLGLPRGGVPVAAEVARTLRLPLDVVLVRKLGVPEQPELAMGAIGEEGVRVLNRDVIIAAGITEGELARVEAAERSELERRAERYRQGRPRVPVTGRIAVLVDDGIATGSTARAACRVARAHGASEVVLAVPVAPPGWTTRLAGAADHLVAIETPDPFFAIGEFYRDFFQTSDEEVMAYLSAAADGAGSDEPPGHRGPAEGHGQAEGWGDGDRSGDQG